MPVFTSQEVARHNGAKSTWMVIANDVYDVTKFLSSHPGGEQTLLDFAGKDATVAFETVGHSEDARDMMKKYKIGVLPESEHSTHAKSCDESLKSSPYHVEFLVYHIDEDSSPLPKTRSEEKKTWRTFDGTKDRVKPSKSQYTTPKSSTSRIEPRVQAIVVPRHRERNRRPPPESSDRLKWALLALAGALVIGFVIKKYAVTTTT